MAEKSKAGGGNKKHGRNKSKCAAYKARKTSERNTIKRVLQSNGFKAALVYARANGLPDPKEKK